MKTNHPHTFEIEIDRKDFERVEALGVRLVAFLIVGFIAFITIIARMESLLETCESALCVIGHLIAYTATAIFIGWLFAWFVHFVYGRHHAARKAASFRATVEGAFLRIVNGRLDRKTHFRSLHNYAVQSQGRNELSDLGTILVNSTENGQIASVKIPSVINALEVRDLLAEIDAERE